MHRSLLIIHNKHICHYSNQNFNHFYHPSKWSHVHSALCFLSSLETQITCMFRSVQSLSHVWFFVTPWTAARQASLFITEFTQTHIHQVSDAIQPSHPRSSPSPPAPNLSQHQSLFQWVNSSHEVAKVLEIQLQHHSLQRNPGLIFRMDWLDLPAVQGTLKSLLQQHSSKASILQCSAFFVVQLSHSYMTTGKNHSFDYMDLCRQSNVAAF